MISIIISTYKENFLKDITKNIKSTIGVDFEIIAIENHAKYSLCEAYNLGVEKAKYQFVCFVHEDVIFKNQDWGNILISLMNSDNSIGLVGVAGTKFRSSYPSALGQSPFLSKFKRGHVFYMKNGIESYLDFDESSTPNEIEDVVCLDGVFLFSKKEVFKHCRFDDILLNHFHGYDIDFSLQVFFAGYRVLVDRRIEIFHASNGNYDRNNTIANRKISKKWWKKLPITTKDTNLSKLDIYKLNFLNWKFFLINALNQKLNRK